MKILVVSDTHGAFLESIIEPIQSENSIDIMIHCGDKYKDAQKLADIIGLKDFYRVTGNCDFDITRGRSILEVEVEGKRVLITHGHLQGVKDGLDKLKILAKKKSADIVFFGHTHISHDEIDDNILYFNPGSTILPRTGKGSYGIVEITSDNVTSKIVYI